MGTVYLATDPVIDRRVAIKVLHVDPTAEEWDEAELQARFELEFRSAGKLSHPNIVTVYDVGEDRGLYFIAMEYVEGESLAQRLKRQGALAVEDTLTVADQVASGLDFAHDNDIVHRDVKPGNVLLTPDGRVKITDFGLAKFLSSDLTQTGTVIGTPAFMAPEQVLGQALDRRTDQFAFAVILYMTLTGDPPFAGDHPSAILYKIVHEDPRQPRQLNATLPEAIDGILLRSLAKNPADRYPTCRDLVDDLRSAIGRRTGAIRGSATIVLPKAADYVTAAGEPTVVAERARATRTTARRRWLLGGLTAIVVTTGLGLLAGTGWRQRDAEGPTEGTAGGPTSDPEPPPISPPPPLEVRQQLVIGPAADGAELWIDGRKEELTGPGEVTLVGLAGDALHLELRRDGQTVAERDLTLAEGGEAIPWDPVVAPRPVPLEITSEPAGAQVSLDGRDTGAVTPTRLPFLPDTRYELALGLAGYDSAGLTFRLGDLSAEQRQRGRLHFPLRRSIPPARLDLDAPYPVQLIIDGRPRGSSASHRLEVEPGEHVVTVVADQVFFRQTYTLRLAPGERLALARPPRAVALQIAATPGNCRVSIDGRFVDHTPINDLPVTLGTHRILFEWPSLGSAKTVDVTVSRDGQRLFERPD